MDDVARIVKGLIAMERERLTGWQGPPGAAYNEISEGLCERGLLDRRWELTETGLAVRRYLEENPDAG